MPQKLLIVSDSVSSHSGLARITRDLASRIHEHMQDDFIVATAGWGGAGLDDFPWKDYPIHNIEGWLLPELPKIAQHFAGDDELIVFFISDPSRLGWFAHPDWCPIPELAEWVRSPKIKKWIYAPIDAEGPNGKLSLKLDYILRGFDKVLNYSKFSSSVTGYPDYLPHGIDCSIFKKYDRNEMKRMFRDSGFVGLEESSFLVGIVATNQPRKDWALGMETCAKLLAKGIDVRLWCHTDVIARHWDIGQMIHDFGMQGRTIVTNSHFPDEQMSKFYSACDVTLGIGSGEGFGYPLAESLASGTPVIHGDYAGGTEVVPPEHRISAVAWRYDGPFCCLRPVFSAEEWASVIIQVEGDMVCLPPELDWENLWPRWRTWLIEGAKI